MSAAVSVLVRRSQEMQQHNERLRASCSEKGPNSHEFQDKLQKSGTVVCEADPDLAPRERLPVRSRNAGGMNSHWISMIPSNWKQHAVISIIYLACVSHRRVRAHVSNL